MGVHEEDGTRVGIVDSQGVDVANGMHTCFYEGWCTREDVEEALEEVAKLVGEVEKIVQR